MAGPKKVAYYLRLSRVDGDLGEGGKNESNSIENQRMLLEEYHSRSADLGGNPRLKYRQEEFDLPHLEYVDDGYTGTNFNRPGFQALLSDCRKGLVSTILVKDMSRLGRNYIEVGDYVEQIFPLLGIRLIAVNENFDTGASEGIDFSIALQNLINTLYVKDCAKKERAAHRVKWSKGILTSKRTPFGYVCDDLKEGWIIDEGAAEIIRLIFEEAAKGHATSAIAEKLNHEGIPTPCAYLRGVGRWNGPKQTIAPEDKLLWNASMVWRILRNESYMGTLVQGKQETVILGGRQIRNVPDKELYKTENAHEPIISEETFQQAQLAIRYQTQKGYRAERKFALKGIARCGNCRRSMLINYGAYGDTIHCGWRQVRKSGCSEESYSYDWLERVVLVSIQQMGSLCDGLLKKRETGKAKNTLSAYRDRVKKIKARKIRAYEEYADGLLSREQFISEKDMLSAELEELENKIADIEAKEEHQKEVTDKLMLVKAAGQAARELQTLTRKMATEMLKAVYVIDQEHVEVVFKFEDAIQEAIEECELEPGLNT